MIADCAYSTRARGLFDSIFGVFLPSCDAVLAAWATFATCACKPASGVRNWCAASATKRRWLSVHRRSQGPATVDRRHQRAHFLGRGHRIQRTQIAGRAAFHSLFQFDQRAQCAAQRVMANKATTASTRLGNTTLRSTRRSHCCRESEPSARYITRSPATVCTRCVTMR